MLSFLDKIGGFFDKAMLVAAVLPLLVGGMLCGAAAGWLIGIGDLTAWWSGLTATATATLTAASTLALFVGAFVLRSLRSWILNVWSGGQWLWEMTGIGPLRETYHGRCRDRLARIVNERSHWLRAESRFRDAIKAVEFSGARPDIEPAKRDALIAKAGDLWEQRGDYRSPNLITEYGLLLTDAKVAYTQYSERSLELVYYELLRLSRDLEATEAEAKEEASVTRDLLYGTTQRVRPNALGNILAALDAYPTRRYGMEGGVFWTHLETVLKDPVLADVREQRILLDMALALASLMIVMAVGVLTIGPWTVHNGALIGVSAAVLIVASFVFYQVAVKGAEALSRALRAGCDLHRQDLLKALLMPVPANLAEEKKSWGRLSMLALYGVSGDKASTEFVFRKPGE